jgi:hypothetical protein
MGMAHVNLSDEMKRAGLAFVGDLDAIGLRPQGVLWLLFPHLGDWRLTVVSDLVDEVGRSRVYALLDEALSARDPVDGFTIFDVHLAASSEILPRVLGGGFKMQLGVAEIVDGNINGMQIDAVLYRMLDPRPAHERKIAAKLFEKTVKALPLHA